MSKIITMELPRYNPNNCLYDEAHVLKRLPFSGFWYMKGWGNISFWLVKRPNRANRCIFVPLKKLRKHPGFVIYSYLIDIAFTAVIIRDAKF